MTQTVFSSARSFQLWSYTVSHRQLLLRSVKSDAEQTRIDILFKDVTGLQMVPVLNSIKIEKIDLSDQEIPKMFIPFAKNRNLYRISDEGFIGYVAAGFLSTAVDEKEYYEPSKFEASLST